MCGYEDPVLRKIATDAKTYGVNLIIVEDNFGLGMFANLLKPFLQEVGHQCEVTTERAGMAKEVRIISTLEPLMDQHRLVIGKQVVEEDDASVQTYRTEEQYKYRLFHQMTRITKDRGSLAHDDRLDALAAAVAYWVEHMAMDSKKAAEKSKEKDRKGDLAWHFKNQVQAVMDPFKSPRKTKKDGLFSR